MTTTMMRMKIEPRVDIYTGVRVLRLDCESFHKSSGKLISINCSYYLLTRLRESCARQDSNLIMSALRKSRVRANIEREFDLGRIDQPMTFHIVLMYALAVKELPIGLSIAWASGQSQVL